MENRIVIIPAYQPDEKLLGTLQDLAAAEFKKLLVVDDGSARECEPIFEKAQAMAEVTLLRHPVNKGKGAALKTAFQYILENCPDCQCVITADADGQHLTKDIQKCGEVCMETGHIVLGTRDFAKAGVPAKSLMGNRITSGVFRLFFGMKIKDTQTGLRAFPIETIKDIITADGDRYEYETNMLFLMNRLGLLFEQVDIETVYIEENKSSHFRVVRDSVRIYALILKYLLSSICGAAVDELLFYLLKKFTFLAIIPVPLTFSAAVIARIVSSLVNYSINAKHVFKGKMGVRTLVRYYILAACQIALSALLVFLIEHLLGIVAPSLSTVAKTIIDTILFFFSFRIQHKWVFGKE